MFKSSSELCDVVSHAIFCTEDNTFLLTQESSSNEHWIPSSKVSDESSWFSQSSKELEEIIGPNTLVRNILKIYKIWSPGHTAPSVYHCIFSVRINGDQKRKVKPNVGKYRGKMKWVQESEISKMFPQENLHSPEILEYFYSNLMTEGVNFITPPEFVYFNNFVEITPNVLILAPSNMGIYEQVIESASFTKDIQTGIFKEFLFLSYPAIYMCSQIFTRFLLQIGWSREEAPFVFRAADLSNRFGLSFRDFMCVLAAMEPTTSHGGTPAEVRCRYIFRFYDRDKDNMLNFNEFKNLISAIRKSKKQPIDATNVTKEAEASYKSMGLNSDSVIGISDFLKAVGDLKLRGTSQLFRSGKSILQYLQNIDQDTQKSQKITKGPISKFEAKTLIGKSEVKNVNYELGEHAVILQNSGTVISIDEIWNMDNAVSASSTRQGTLLDSYKRISADQFSQISITNELLKSLRYLNHINKGKPMTKNAKNVKMEPYSWGQMDSQVYAKNFVTICMQVRDLFMSESRLIEINAPTYVMGDLHGNMASLLYFEKVLWHLGPGLCPCNLLFLGDYVDRGPYSLEVISYLFCYKIQAPGKLKMLRGNHEIREIQKMFTFYTECLHKFGERNGPEIWNAVNIAFDSMPLAATIDGKIFCCHGGIPPPWLCPTVTTINSIPCPLNLPNEQSALAWEIMWNDPINKSKQTGDEVMLELLTNDGFAANTRRGTAHVFSVEALERFLNTNGFSHIIRAHEVAHAGFNVLQKGKLLTVFSSAKYCGGVNEAACVLADQGKLRILRLDTN